MDRNYKLETLLLHAGYTPEPTTLSMAVPVYRTTSYIFKNTQHAADLFYLRELGNIYTRIMNPTTEILEKRLASVEGGKAALALASGTSAIFYTVINICDNGDEVVSASNLYGGTYTMFDTILPKLGVKVNFVNPLRPEEFEARITEKTRMLYVETIGNPVLDVVDLGKVAKKAQKYHIPLVVDSTFTTPYLLRPIDFGANIVCHSLTKWIGGHGTAIGGIIIDAGNFDWRDSKFTLYNTPDSSYHGLKWAWDLGENNDIAFAMRMRLVPLRNLGACISPDNAWMFLQGLETLHLRMERHSENALQVAEFLKKHSKVSWVRYPGLRDDPSFPIASKYMKNGFGGMVVFGVKGGREAGERFINNLKLISHLANVGDAKTLAIHPASTTHSQIPEEEQLKQGLTPDLIRLSVGLENIDDIIGDIEYALGKV